MVNDEFFPNSFGFMGFASVGKTQTLQLSSDILQDRGYRVLVLSVGNIFRLLALSLDEKLNIDNDRWRDLPNETILQAAQLVSVRSDRNQTYYCINGLPQNGRLKEDPKVGVNATILGGIWQFSKIVEDTIIDTVGKHPDFLIGLDGRNIVAQRAEVVTVIRANREETLRIFREEHHGMGQRDIPDEEIERIHKLRDCQDIKNGLFFPRRAIYIDRPYGTKNIALARQFVDTFLNRRQFLD